MREIIVAFLLCLVLSPVYAENNVEESAVQKATRYLKAAAPLAKEVAKDVSAKESPPETKSNDNQQGPDKGFWEKTKIISQGIVPDIDILKETWSGLKETCTSIKDTGEKTLCYLIWIAISAAVLTSIVPILLLIIIVYLHKINKKLRANSRIA